MMFNKVVSAKNHTRHALVHQQCICTARYVIAHIHTEGIPITAVRFTLPAQVPTFTVICTVTLSQNYI